MIDRKRITLYGVIIINLTISPDLTMVDDFFSALFKSFPDFDDDDVGVCKRGGGVVCLY